MSFRIALACLGLNLIDISGFGQCAEADFSLPANACSQQSIHPEHTLDDGEFNWDFCTGDLSLTPTGTGLTTLSQAVGRPSIELVKDGEVWYGFVTGTWTNTLYRLTFGNGIRQDPTTVENLGSLDNALNNPGAIRLLQEGATWYGLIHNTGNGQLLKLDFGSGLTNNPDASVLLTGVGYINTGLACGRDPADGWIAVLSNADNSVTVVRLGPDLSPPDPADILTTSPVPNPNNLGDLDLVQSCGEWFAYAANLGNANVYSLAFGATLFQAPSITQIGTLGSFNPGRLRLAYDAGKYWALIATLGGDLLEVDLGSDLASGFLSVINLGDFSDLLQNSYGLHWMKEDSEWTALISNQSDGRVSRIDFPNPCDASLAVSFDSRPAVVFGAAGIQRIDLQRNDSGTIFHDSESVTISALTAPDVNFGWQGACAQHDVTFVAQGDLADITAFDWDFGDLNVSTLQDPVHSFSTSGQFEVELEVSASNGCMNKTIHPVPVYDAPVTDFYWSASGLLCTNQPYFFQNTTAYDPGSSPQWEWRIDEVQTSTEKDAELTFTVPDDHTVELIAAIPGCTSSVQKIVPDLEVGPLVDFMAPSLGCQGVQIQFNNATTGSVESYVWDFDDGTTSLLTSPSHPFSGIGTYQITLRTLNLAGCENFTTKPLTIYTTPEPDFSLALPPFSCNGSPSQFTDLTSSPTDSNLTLWSWDFGDQSSTSDVSALRNPAYTYSQSGSYDVALSVSTNFGCGASVLRSILISSSPSSAFSHTPACAGEPTMFDGPETGVVVWNWNMGSNSYSTSDATHTFNASGNVQVTLTTTGSNGCQSSAQETVVIPPLPTLDFEVLYACTDQLTEHTDRSVAGLGDPFVRWDWILGDHGPVQGNPVTYSYSVPDNVPVELRVTAQSGCIYVHTEDVAVTVAPIAYFSATPVEGQSPLAVDFSASTGGVSGWSWAFDDGSPVQAGSSVNHIFTSVGEYRVELTVTNPLQCIASTARIVRVIVPEPDVRISGFFLTPATSGFVTPVVVIKNSGNTTISSLPVQLIMNGTSIVQERLLEELTPGQSKSYAFSFTLPEPGDGQYLCAATDLEFDKNPLDNRACLQESGDLTLLTPSPSPAYDHIVIDWISDGTPVRLSIHDTHASQLLERDIPAGEPGLYRLGVDVSGLAPGIYIVHLHSGSSRATSRFMVNR